MTKETKMTAPVQEALYRDYLMIDGRRITPNGIRAQFDQLREQCMDLPLRAAPITSESSRVLDPKSLSENDRYALDMAEYDLEDPNADERIKNEFQYCEHMMRAITTNQSVLMRRRRAITKEANDLDILWRRLFWQARESIENPDAVMGKSENAKVAWFNMTYPCIDEVRQLYKGMLAEMDIEKERLQTLYSSISRELTAIQDDYQVRGMLGGVRIAGHNE
jgi:hypothetical protein